MTITDERKTKKQLLDKMAELQQRVDALQQKVTELETAESKHSQDGELLDIFRSSTPIGLFVIQNGAFQFVNNNFLQITGGSSGELIGMDPRRLVHPEDREMIRDNAIKMLKGERSSPYRYRIIQPDGETRWILEGVSPVQYRGERAVLGHSLDITEQERAQEKLEEAYEKERSLRKQLQSEVERRIDFTRSLVHELKTPLTPVLSSSELLFSELHEEPWMSIAENIHRGAVNLSTRIDELLDLARVEIGTLKLRPKVIDALKLLKGIGNAMMVVAQGAGQTLTLSLPESLPPVWADKERLQQVVQNLLINASKFTPEGGKITMRARTEAGFMVVEVKDNGPGVPKKDQERLFLPYHRQLTDREHLSGLGLGLALCKYLVELHGGKIWVKSRAGRGATFGFSVPLATESQQQESSKEEMD